MSEWKEHDGEGMPADAAARRVEVEYRDGIHSRCFGHELDGEWSWENHPADVVRYRLLDTPSSEEAKPVKTLRDEFAMAALVGIGTWMPVDSEGVVHSNLNHGRAQMDRAKWAYAQADAMLAARKEK